MIEAIKRGSIISWQHINMQGEYDFIKHVANDQLFDIDKIMDLELLRCSAPRNFWTAYAVRASYANQHSTNKIFE